MTFHLVEFLLRRNANSHRGQKMTLPSLRRTSVSGSKVVDLDTLVIYLRYFMDDDSVIQVVQVIYPFNKLVISWEWRET